MNTHLLTVATQPHLCPLSCEDCTVSLEISGTSSLHDLAALIIKSIGFDFDHPFGFYD